MRKILLSIAAVAAAVSAVPATAQSWRAQPVAGRQIQNEIAQLTNQIARAEQRRAISPREANGLGREALQLQRSYNRFARDGLDRRELRQIETQLENLRQRLRLERRDFDRRRG
jgi:hypothetical protein